MEKQSYYLIILLVALVICFGVFWFQFNNAVPTFMIVNETQVHENGSFSGMLMDAYSYGVPNQTITFHKPGYEMGTLVDVVTDENGEFTIEMQNICLMQAKTIIMVISHLQAMANIRAVPMRAMLL